MTESKVGHRRRDLLRFAGVGAAAALLGGCGAAGGDRSADESGGRSPSPSTAGRGGGFPVTIDGVEGAITLDAAPTRVVSVGQYRDTDAAVALGVVPLATPNLDHFMQGGISPWVRERLTGEPPALFEFADGLPFEQLATFAPDLILATDHVDLDKDYATLTGIAPTLSKVSGYRDAGQCCAFQGGGRVRAGRAITARAVS
ncbi:hypothetical protein [Actinopolymorpha pittospori]|uniref:ABC-type Fe3+-hydroxamate transport system substrate-binding protein n=1 Tax=Actinopolymorpha pittospori TaxID=648752 RepID=A0A927MS56_9ACTN|nr:hypothetical protein [Actinopolymorpha pittospori]MBE1605871.1 ABC-type Fe3+-hydroxamate transport system substrate-binding protein [Actinopolymorpha pittospori]